MVPRRASARLRRTAVRREGSLRGQPFDRPVIACPTVADPVVKAVRGCLPELDAVGKHPEAAPALGTGEVSVGGVAELHVLHQILEGGLAGDDAALGRGGGVAAGSRRACTPVLVGFLLTYWLDGSRHPYLTVDRAKPVQNGSCLRIGGQLSTLVAGEVGEEGRPPLEAAKYHHPCRRDAISGRVARVMASGIGSPALRAASSQAASCRSGSASRSTISTRSVLPGW